MKKIIFSAIILFILSSCSESNVELAKDVSGDAHHVGEILKKSKSRILVEEVLSNYGQPLSQVWVTINSETVMLDSEGNQIEINGLKKGQLVEVWNDGRILESYPAQTNAIKIKLIPN